MPDVPVSVPLFVPQDQLAAGLATLRQAPREVGVVAMVVRRLGVDAREELQTGQLDPKQGLIGDDWVNRGSSRTPDRSPHPDTQIAIMGARTLALISPDRDRWPLAGDQLIIDLDLSYQNLPPGTQLQVGAAKLVVTDQPHTGCAKFMARYGKDALMLLNSPEGRELNLRGIHARVLEPGTIKPGDVVAKLDR